MTVDFERIWGSDGSALNTEPDAGKVELGWEQGGAASPPEAAWQNWNMWRVTYQLQYLMNYGAVEWSTGANFKEGAVVHYSGSAYSAKRDNVGVQPDTGTDDWLNLGGSLFEFIAGCRNMDNADDGVLAVERGGTGVTTSTGTGDVVRSFAPNLTLPFVGTVDQVTNSGIAASTGFVHNMLSSSKLENGYQHINGLLVQWGITASISVDTGVSWVDSPTGFPISFPNGVFQVLGSISNNGTSSDPLGPDPGLATRVKSGSLSTFEYLSETLGGSARISFLAIGY